MSDIGKYIKELREAKKYSQRKLSYLSHISNATINRIEKGLTIPEPDTLKKLSSPLGISYIKLMNMAGYVHLDRFIPSNIKLIREKNGMTYSQMAADIKNVTGMDVSPSVLESLERGKDGDVLLSYIDILAKYEGISPDFFFRENTPSDLEYAIKHNPYGKKGSQKDYLPHIKDKDLKNWISSPDSLHYLHFAKRVYDLGISLDLSLFQLVEKMFEDKDRQ
ncbi:MAG: helix-turn-helix transcriptional regulator [Clostridiales bacterium]|jgi:transcriptional regulator with XRE-family HTH domain|nr:transcriptional regulator [Eubacteriales bacterium]MDH7567615.1 helix-turn-helix transcriptional regulator [Clostridiales bacterium]